MICPDTERLIGFGLGQRSDPELQIHVDTCEECQADLATLQALVGKGEPERDLSEELITRIIAGLPEPDAFQGKEPNAKGHLLATWGLGFLTAVGSAVAGGTIGLVQPSPLLFLAIGFGGICATASLRANRGPTSSNSTEPAREPA